MPITITHSLITFTHPFIQSFNLSFIHSFIHLFNQSFTCWVFHSFTHPSNHSCIHSTIHSNIESFSHSIIQSISHCPINHLATWPFFSLRSFSHSINQPFNQSAIQSFTHPAVAVDTVIVHHTLIYASSSHHIFAPQLMCDCHARLWCHNGVRCYECAIAQSKAGNAGLRTLPRPSCWMSKEPPGPQAHNMSWTTSIHWHYHWWHAMLACRRHSTHLPIVTRGPRNGATSI